MQVYVGEMR